MAWKPETAVRNALIAVGAAALLVFAGVKYTSVRTRLLAERAEIGARWAGVGEAMQRRADLIFGLIAPMKGLSKGSKGVVGKIAEARALLAASRAPHEKMAAYDRLNEAISRLPVVFQDERRLRPGAALAHLADDVSNTENEVNIARQRYNDALENYNTALQLFPNNIVAALSGFTRNDAYFQTGTGAGQGAKMQF
jgi:LemA protein